LSLQSPWHTRSLRKMLPKRLTLVKEEVQWIQYMAPGNKIGGDNYTPAHAGISLFSRYVYKRCNDRKSM
jgi:hypothetical protein